MVFHLDEYFSSLLCRKTLSCSTFALIRTNKVPKKIPVEVLTFFFLIVILASQDMIDATGFDKKFLYLPMAWIIWFPCRNFLITNESSSTQSSDCGALHWLTKFNFTGHCCLSLLSYFSKDMKYTIVVKLDDDNS